MSIVYVYVNIIEYFATARRPGHIVRTFRKRVRDRRRDNNTDGNNYLKT